MSADLIPFIYNDQPVRTVVVDGEPWFVLADLCAVLDLSNPSMVAERIDDDALSTAEVIDSMGRSQLARVVNEPGMYQTIFMSRKPEAVAFRRWITTDVLPTIRKTGGYSATPELTEDQIVLQALQIQSGRIEVLQAKVAELEPPAKAWTHMAAASGDYLVGDAAKILSRDPAILLGRDRLFAFMAAIGWVYRGKSKRGGWRAYQTQVECGRLVEKMSSPFLNQKTGDMELPDPTVRVTAKGLAELHKQLGGTEPLAQLAAAS